MEEPILYCEDVVLALFNVKYNVVVSNDTDAMIEHIEELYDGVYLTMQEGVPAYTCKIAGPGSNVEHFVFLNSSEIKDSIELLIHEAVNLSWLVLEYIGVELTKQNKTIQGYICEEIYRQLIKVYNSADQNNIDSL